MVTADVDGTSPRSMSLSRRYLSLPQELLGTSLPPKVSGKRRGFVTLCLAHILPSAVSSSPLPRESLVRVRWWGEEAPGSLFRPQLLSEEFYPHKTRTDKASYSPHRAISMKYPVTVLPEQLLEYFEDMGNLTLEVIDRDSRKKYGECLLPLNLQKVNQVMTAEEKLVALRRENVLCEVKFCGEDDVAGYLAVAFDVNWTDVEIEENVEVDVKIEDRVENVERFAAGSSVSSSLSSNREWAGVDSQGTGIGDADKQGQGSDVVKEDREVKAGMESHDFSRIQKLLEKGKALQQSMENAVKDTGDEELDEAITGDLSAHSDVVGDNGTQFALQASLFTPDSDYSKIDDGWLPKSPDLVPLSGSTRGFHAAAEQVDITPRLDLPEELNTLTISFESLELNHDFVDSQLRQLRDASSVSSRSSPIQIHVSHDGISSLLKPQLDGEESVPETSAFAVTTSLRKCEWQLNCFSTVPLTQLSGLLGGNNTESGSTTTRNMRDKAKQFRFRVRCENQHDSRRSKRRHEHDLFCRPIKRVLLEGAADVAELLAVAKRVDKTWTTAVQLHLKRTDNQVKNDPNVDERKKGRKGKQRPVGYLKLKFAFHHVDPSNRSNVSEMKSAEDDHESELLLSSISSNPSEVEVDPKQNNSDAVSDLSGRKVYRQTHLLQSSLENSTDTYKSFQFAVMLDDVSMATLSSLSDRRVQTGRSTSNSSSAVVNNVGRGADANLLDAASISVQYSVPSHFSKTRPVSDKFERTITRKLKASRWSYSSPLLWADLSGITHVFQSSFAEDSCEYFSTSYLIIEIWTNYVSDSKGSLLGLAKVPLRALAGILRADLSAFSKRALPVVSVDDKFPIENPFTGQASGYLRGRVCLGTSEQILTWTKTIRAVIKLQSILRGVFSRQHFRRFNSATSQVDVMLDQPRSVELSSVNNRSESQSTAPTLALGIRATDFDDTSADDLNPYEMVKDQDDFGKYTGVPINSSVRTWHEVDYFESCRTLDSDTGEQEKVVFQSSSSDDEPHDIGERHEEHAGVSDIELVANSVAHSSLDRDADIEASMLLQNNDPSEAVQRDRVAYAEKNVQVDPFELEQIEMVSCSVQTAPDENLSDEDVYANNGEGNDQLGDIISTVDVGCDAMEDMDSPGEVCQVAEKAIQVGPSELGLQIEMVACSVQTVPEESIQIEPGEVVSEDGYDEFGPSESGLQIEMVSCSVQSAPDENLSDEDVCANNGEGNDQLGDIISTVDVGCDAMEDMDSPGEVCQVAEKAIQVGPSELGLQIEMVACSVQTVPEESIQIEPGEVVSEDGYDEFGPSESGLQIEMVSCSVQSAPDENLSDEDVCANNGEGDDRLEVKISTVDVGCDAIDCMDMPGEVCQFAEKAIQVGPSELGLQIEMVACSAQTVPEESIQIEPGEVVFEGGYDGISSDDHLETETATVNVGCDAMNRKDIPGEKVIQVDPSELGLQIESCPVQTVSDEHLSDESVCADNGDGDDHLVDHILTVDVGCDAMEGMNIQTCQYAEKSIQVQIEMVACSVQTVPDESFQIGPGEVISENGSNKDGISTGDELEDKTSTRKFGNVANGTWWRSEDTQQSPSPQFFRYRQLVGWRTENKPRSFDGRNSVAVPRTSRHDTGSYRDTIDRLPSSHTPVVNSLQKNQLDESDHHLSTHSLFTHDSETERIARIMQGSMKYWMKDDCSSSGWEEGSDEEDASDNCYF